MYESITYDQILSRMLDCVPDSLDKREGSVIYTALAPAAVELQNMYIQLDVILNESFADTASRDALIKMASTRGISPKPASSAVLKGEFNQDIPLGSRFSLDALNYKALEKMEDHVYRMQCETTGSAPNGKLGDLIPIDYIEGLTSAKLTELLIPGEDEEDTDAFRQRYLESFQSAAFGGNVADYKQTVLGLPGVGGVKVYPVWNGGGTVKLVLLDAAFKVPSEELIQSVQTAMDPTQNSGQGMGLAPIGHTVTVAAAQSTSIDITTSIVYEKGWDWSDVEPHVQEAVDGYFTDLASQWDDSDQLVVRISQIETRLLALEGIVDIADTTVNSQPKNLVLDADCIPVRGEIRG